jgi:UDPglucose 6-dehydrogenase
MNPEFLKEGSAIYDTLHPDRIIIGEFDKRSGSALNNLYRNFFRRNIPTRRMSIVEAELVKYANNSFLAMKVSFANMIANLCQKLPSCDVQVITEAVGLDKRIGKSFLRAGLGYGGSCFPKDLAALLSFGDACDVNLPLIRATVAINKNQPLQAIKLGERLVGKLSGKRIALLGLAFKPNTDDIREAASIRIVQELLKRHAKVIVYDPKAVPQTRRVLGDAVTYAESAIQCLRGSDLSILVTEWKSFGQLRPKDFTRLMKQPSIVDGRRIFDASEFVDSQFRAIGLGTSQNH